MKGGRGGGGEQLGGRWGGANRKHVGLPVAARPVPVLLSPSDGLSVLASHSSAVPISCCQHSRAVSDGKAISYSPGSAFLVLTHQC